MLITLQPLIGYDPNLKVNLESFFELNYTNVSTVHVIVIFNSTCLIGSVCMRNMHPRRESKGRGVLGVCCSHGKRMNTVYIIHVRRRIRGELTLSLRGKISNFFFAAIHRGCVAHTVGTHLPCANRAMCTCWAIELV